MISEITTEYAKEEQVWEENFKYYTEILLRSGSVGTTLVGPGAGTMTYTKNGGKEIGLKVERKAME